MALAIDIFCLVFALITVLLYTKRGLIKGVFHCAKTILAFVFAYLFGERAGEWLFGEVISASLPSLLELVLGYVAVFLVSILVLLIVAAILSKICEHIPIIGAVNRILGALLGLVIAFMTLAVIASIVKLLLEDADFYAESVVLNFFGESGVLDTLTFLDLSALFG